MGHMATKFSENNINGAVLMVLEVGYMCSLHTAIVTPNDLKLELDIPYSFLRETYT